MTLALDFVGLGLSLSPEGVHLSLPTLRSLMNSGLSSPSLASHINQLSVCLINTAIVHDRPQNLIYSGSGRMRRPSQPA